MSGNRLIDKPAPGEPNVETGVSGTASHGEILSEGLDGGRDDPLISLRPSRWGRVDDSEDTNNGSPEGLVSGSETGSARISGEPRSGLLGCFHALKLVLLTGVLALAGGDLVPFDAEQNHRVVDEDYIWWLPKLPRKPLRLRGHRTQPEKPGDTRKAHWAICQRSWRRDRGSLSDSILDGSYWIEEKTVDFSRFDSYWKALFSTPSVSDTRVPQRLREPQWDLIGLITINEYKRNLKQVKAKTSPGPDGWRRADIAL